MSRYRARMRAAGLRLIQIWVPDIGAGYMAKEIRRQSKLVSRRKSEREASAFIDAAGKADATG